MYTTSNPVTERIDQLHDQWVSFSDHPDARLMIWLASDDELPFVEGFLTKECNPETSETDDLFLELRSPFEDEMSHGQALANELAALFEASSETAGGDLGPTFAMPATSRGDGDTQLLIALLIALRRHHLGDDSRGRLAIWLHPGEISANRAYLFWLGRLVREAPSELRFFVLDRPAEPSRRSLALTEPSRVLAQVCGLDTTAALCALAQGEGRQTPGDRFRVLQQQLAQAIGARDLASAIALATRANELALAQDWFHLAAVVQLVLGAAYVGGEKLPEALKTYAEAERLARKREAQERERTASADSASAMAREPAYGMQLRLQARLAQGAVLISGRAFKLAAEMYLEAIVIAKSLDDPRAQLDAHRLASFCYSELGEADRAWELGIDGLKLGLAMDEEARKTSTLFYLADHMLRMTKKHRAYADYRPGVESQLAARLGPNWRAQLVSAKAA